MFIKRYSYGSGEKLQHYFIFYDQHVCTAIVYYQYLRDCVGQGILIERQYICTTHPTSVFTDVKEVVNIALTTLLSDPLSEYDMQQSIL